VSERKIELKKSSAESEKKYRMKRKMEPLLIELLLITLTVCASSSASQQLESTQPPLVVDESKKVDSHQEIRLNITLKRGDDDEKENVDIDMGKYEIVIILTSDLTLANSRERERMSKKILFVGNRKCRTPKNVFVLSTQKVHSAGNVCLFSAYQSCLFFFQLRRTKGR
jgi:hypothetical protein